VATTNHIVAIKVNHAHNMASRVTISVTEKCQFDLKLIEAVKLTAVLCDSHLGDYKLAEKKLTLWLEIADKLG